MGIDTDFCTLFGVALITKIRKNPIVGAREFTKILPHIKLAGQNLLMAERYGNGHTR